MAVWQLSKRMLKRLRIMVVVAIILAFLYWLPALLISIPSVQRFVAQEISKELTKVLGTPVSMDRVSLDGWQAIELTGIKIFDQRGRRAIFANKLKGGVELEVLWREQKLRLNSIRLFYLRVLLNIDSRTGKTNLQHIIEALSSQDDSQSALAIDISNALVRDGTLTVMRDEELWEELSHVNLQVDELKVSGGDVSGTLNTLSFETSRGFNLNRLAFQFELKGEIIQIKDLQLKLPRSQIEVPLARLYTKDKGLSLVQALELKGVLKASDCYALLPELKALSEEDIELDVALKRKDPSSRSGHLKAKSKELLSLDLKTQIYLDSLGRMKTIHLDADKFDFNVSPWGRLASMFLDELRDKPLLDRLRSLGRLGYRGEVDVDLFSSKIALGGSITTDLGALDVDTEASFESSKLAHLHTVIKTRGLNLSPLLDERLGALEGEVSADLSFNSKSSYPRGKLDLSLLSAELWGEKYQDIRLSTQSDGYNKYHAQLSSRDIKLPLKVEASFKTNLLGGIEDITVLAKGEPHALSKQTLGFDLLDIDGRLDLNSLNLRNPKGSLHLGHIAFALNGQTVRLRDINLSLSEESGIQSLVCITPFLTLSLLGKYQLANLPEAFLSTLTSELSAIAPLISSKEKKAKREATQATLDVELKHIPTSLTKALRLPIGLKQDLSLQAYLNTQTNKLELTAQAKDLELGGYKANNLRLKLQENKLEINGDIYEDSKPLLLGFRTSVKAKADSLSLYINGSNVSDGGVGGLLSLKAYFPHKSSINKLKDLSAVVEIERSQIRFKDAVWNIKPSKLIYTSGLFQVQGLEISTGDKFIQASGGLNSWVTSDELSLSVQNINLGYILRAAGVDFDLIDTELTGHIRAKLNEHKHLVASAQVKSPSFTLNRSDIGSIDIGVSFSTEDLLIRLNGKVQQSHGGHSLVNGWVKPANGAGIHLDFQTHDIQISFLHSFMQSFLSKLTGYGTGSVRLHGLFERGVTATGEVNINKGRLGIGVLGTEYNFEHKLLLENERIHLGGLLFSDDEGHTGRLDGYVTHKYLDDYGIDIRASQLLGIKVLDTKTPKLMPAYGSAYASGFAALRGSSSRLKVELDLTSEKGTDMMLDFDQTVAEKDNALIRFTNLRKPQHTPVIDSLHTASFEAESSTAFDLDLKLTVTPQALLKMRLGEDKASILSGKAEGAIRITAPSGANPEVYGTLAIREGEYLFYLQQLARKRFVIREGGSVSFRGDPMKATIHNLHAVYPLTANISDLDEMIAKDATQTNVRVHCILQLSGAMMKPEVKFALELPSLDAEIERRVRALLNTDDAVMRQMLYLIALGKFYTNDLSSRTTKTTNDWTAVASNAISEQLSSLLGRLTQKVRLGTTIKTKSTAFDETDIELNFSGSLLGDRLTINGNIGYHDNPYLNKEYLGEFDLEYKLNRSGSFRLKGYNKYNAMYQYLRQSLLTQGFGVLYRQRFDSFQELIRRKKPKTVDTVARDTLAK